MDNIELILRRRTQSYDAVAQQDGNVSLLSAAHELATDKTPGSTISSKHSHSTSKSSSEHAERQQLIGVLLPKAYTKPTRSKRFWRHFGLAAAFIFGMGVPVGIFFAAFSASAPDSSNFVGDIQTTYCTDLQLKSAFFSGDGFAIQNLLNIDTAVGKLSFGTAKFIDLIWDVGFSRGGQAFLAWMTYKVYTAAMVRIMETHRVSYDFFATFSLSWPRLWDLCPLWKTFSTTLGVSRKILLLWVALSILWVGLWSTLTNAMTGYVGSNDTMVKLQNASGYGKYSDIANPDTIAFQYLNISIPDSTHVGGYAAIGPVLTKTGPNVALWSTLNNIIQEEFDPNAAFYDGMEYWPQNDSNTPAVPFYYFDNQSYVYDYFQTATLVQCVANGSYQWGFSSSLVLVWVGLNTFWVVGTYGVWIHLNRKSTLVRNRHMGRYRAAIDMVEAIRNDLGNDICAYTDEELDRELRKRPGVRYSVEYGKEPKPAHICLSSRNDHVPATLTFGKLYGQEG